MRFTFSAAILSGVLFYMHPAVSQEIPYQSAEFQNPDSRIPVIFACAFAGHQSGLDVEATEVVMDFMGCVAKIGKCKG